MGERYDLILEIIGYLEDASKDMKELRRHENDIDVIGDIIRGLEVEKTNIENALYAQDEREQAALNREYLRSVL